MTPLSWIVVSAAGGLSVFALLAWMLGAFQPPTDDYSI